MIPLITSAIATNIAGHTKNAWTYSTPNDDAAENIITQGFLPFYANAEQKGGSTTIVDVKIDQVALDVKCRDVLTFYKQAPSKTQLKSDNTYHKVLDNLWVKIPNSVICPVRRPKTDTQGYCGNAQVAIIDQIAEYKTYATRTTNAAGCTDLHSVIFLYGEGTTHKAIYIEEQSFSTPTPVTFSTYYNKKGQPAGYDAFDANDKVLYKLLDYSKGSTNFNKRFDINTGYLFVWPKTAISNSVINEQDWVKQGNYSLCI